MNGSRMINILMKIKKMDLETDPHMGRTIWEEGSGEIRLRTLYAKNAEKLQKPSSETRTRQCLPHSSQKDASHRLTSAPYSADPLISIRPHHCDFLHSIPKSDTSKFLEIPESCMPLVCVQWSGRGWFLCVLELMDHKTSLTLKVMSPD